MDQEITLKLSLQNTNAVLQALGQMPYIQVAELIALVRGQAESQVNRQPEVAE